MAWPCGRAVDHDEVVVAGPLELFDASQHDDVVDPGGCGADHVDHAGLAQPGGDPTEAVLAQVVVEGVRRRDRQHLEVGHERGEGGLAVEFDDEHTPA